MQLPDWSVLESLHNHFAAVAVHMVNEGQEVSPQLFFLGLEAGMPPFVMAAVPPSLTHQFFRDDSGKNMLAQFLRHVFLPESELRASLAKELGFSPVVVVQISEAWMAKMKEGDDFKGYHSGQKRVSERTDRQEVVLVTLHLEHFSIPVMHPIEFGPPRQCKLASFPEKSAVPQYGGRLSMQEINSTAQGPLQ